jgi:hypothetical protein
MRTVTLRVTLAASWVLAACLSSRAFAQAPQPQPSPPPQPYPQPYPPPYPAPYPQQYYPQQYPPPPPIEPTSGGRRIHDGEVIADFAMVGTLAAVDILLRQDVDNGSFGTMILLGGLFGGGAGGYLLTQKYDVDAAAAHSTTIGLVVGAANGALLIKPMLEPDYHAEDVMGLLFLGSAVGAGAGFIYGQKADLTDGQSTFLGTAVLLGTSTAALTAILGSKNGTYDSWENGALAVGLDAGLLGGALIAPQLTWSKKRARIVLAGTVLGALAGGMVAGLTTKKRNDGDDYNGNVVAGCMTAGLWAGFGLGIIVTRDSDPDPKYLGNGPAAPSGASTSFAPFVGERAMGVTAGGTW